MELSLEWKGKDAAMVKKQLYMIGNSHIDPVWFWNWEEGMQEVKATFASALERMKEFPEFTFTSTSAAFFLWIEKIAPEMFEEIKRRVAEGRWELTGGWFIEPDCILPSGEAFARQGLYSQRFFMDRFGKSCHIGSNVDSFGHNHMLPQLLRKSGMDSYVFMRPRLNTPVFCWEGEDGSRVDAISLPAEYTTWFHEPTKKNIEDTLARTQGFDHMPCCFGVGNHGGGPTIENIESILALKDWYDGVEMKFSDFDTFFRSLEGTKKKTLTGAFEHVNEGCYSVDSRFKKLNRLAEKRLVDADILYSMAKGAGRCLQEGSLHNEKMKELWQLLLFNHFHDTMGGTAIKPARDEAVMQMSQVCSGALLIKAAAMQDMVNGNDTAGEGFPLFLFNTDGQAYEDYAEAELEWFCQSPLTLLDSEGREVEYQRIHTEAKVRHTVLGGRRRIIFPVSIPSMGYREYRLLKKEPRKAHRDWMQIDNPKAQYLENDCIRIEFDKVSGMLCSLYEKKTKTQILTEPVSFRIWTDERDTWGGDQGRCFEDTKEAFVLESLTKVESGSIRQGMRAVYTNQDSRWEQLYYLYEGREEVLIENRLLWNRPWSLLKIAFPLGKDCSRVKAESSYGILKREIKDDREYYMHRFTDAADEKGFGLAIANNGKYAFNLENGRFQITVARSAIYSQGNSPDWYQESESYQYTDRGEQSFVLLLRPHKEPLSHDVLYKMAARAAGGIEYLADSVHGGENRRKEFSLASVDHPAVRVMLVKKAEEDEDYVVRLLETEGKDRACTLHFLGKAYPITIGHHEIKTIKINTETQSFREVDLIEWTQSAKGETT